MAELAALGVDERAGVGVLRRCAREQSGPAFGKAERPEAAGGKPETTKPSLSTSTVTRVPDSICGSSAMAPLSRNANLLPYFLISVSMRTTRSDDLLVGNVCSVGTVPHHRAGEPQVWRHRATDSPCC